MHFEGLLQTIEEFDTITIFRHENPDCDAVGSQFGLKSWIQENYPDKQVYALGNEECHQGPWPHQDKAEEEVIADSLAIVVDTANITRVDDQRFLHAAKIVKIDHHPNHEPFGDQMYVFDDAAAVCEILTVFFSQQKDRILSKKTAEYLYRGLLTDTLNYTTNNTKGSTLRAGAILADTGIDMSRISHDVFDHSLNGYRFTGYIISHTEVKENKLGYVVITEEDRKAFGLSAGGARSFVSTLGNVRDFEIWCIFTQKFDEDGNVLYDGSLRAKSLQVNDIASLYHGGGHCCAAGVKNLNPEDVEDILSLLCKRIAEN